MDSVLAVCGFDYGSWVYGFDCEDEDTNSWQITDK
jgi:hypothetical protein